MRENEIVDTCIVVMAITAHSPKIRVYNIGYKREK